MKNHLIVENVTKVTVKGTTPRALPETIASRAFALVIWNKNRLNKLFDLK
jgi:hypothetical protein